MSLRPLHFVFKVGDRKASAHFFRQVLGMKFLRHEEFEKGCEATCNGPYDGQWSKSMVGYGPEDDHFVLELTYNYGIGSYELGNDFGSITIRSPDVFRTAVAAGKMPKNDRVDLVSPDGHSFRVLNEANSSSDPVVAVSLASSSLSRSLSFWVGVLGLTVEEQTTTTARLAAKGGPCQLELFQVDGAVNHAKAFGRIAFACPSNDLSKLQAKVEAESGKQRIKTPLVSLDTPGKATVQVVILTDPDDHEICLVGDEAFRELSKVDSGADEALDAGIEKDGSDAWYAKKGKVKPTA